jgi:hypothetical protein
MKGKPAKRIKHFDELTFPEPGHVMLLHYLNATSDGNYIAEGARYSSEDKSDEGVALETLLKKEGLDKNIERRSLCLFALTAGVSKQALQERGTIYGQGYKAYSIDLRKVTMPILVFNNDALHVTRCSYPLRVKEFSGTELELADLIRGFREQVPKREQRMFMSEVRIYEPLTPVIENDAYMDLAVDPDIDALFD